MYFRSSDMEKLTHKLETRYMSFGDDFGAIRKAIVDYGTIDPKVRSWGADVDMDNICEGFEDLNWLEQTDGEIPHDFADIVSTLQYSTLQLSPWQNLARQQKFCIVLYCTAVHTFKTSDLLARG